MAYEIKIYGEIVSTYAKHNGAKGFSLEDLQSLLANADGQDLKVRINSVGGDCQEGFAIYDELRRYARQNKASIHTFGESNLASIATVIFLAGDVREVSRSLEPFVHNAWSEAVGDADSMRKSAEELDRWNDKIAKHYSEHTDLTYKEARELMNTDTFLSPEEAKIIRFATKVEKVARPMALQRFTNPNTNKMNKKTIKAQLLEILGMAIQNKKVNTADQQILDFYELEEDEPIEVGANATIDGQPAEGDYVMENGDTYVFASGVLTEIIPADEEPEENPDASEVDALKAEIEALKAEKEAVLAQAEELRVSNKQMRTALNNVRKLQSEIVDTETTAPQKPRAIAPPAKGSRFGKALQNFESINKK